MTTTILLQNLEQFLRSSSKLTITTVISSFYYSEDDEAPSADAVVVVFGSGLSLLLLFVGMMMMKMIWNEYYHVYVPLSKPFHVLGCPVVWNTPEGRAWPLLGHGWTFARSPPWDVLRTWHHRHRRSQCSVFFFPLLGRVCVSVACPTFVKAILQAKVACTAKDVQFTLKPFLSILGTGIVSSDGEKWWHQRLKMSHPLRHDCLDTIPQQTLLALQRLFRQFDDAADAAAAAADKNNTKPIALGDALRHLTLQVISGVFLSLLPEESDDTFAKFYLPIVDESNVRIWHPYRTYCFFLPSWWMYQYNVYKLNQYVSSIIQTRWNQRVRLLGATDNKNINNNTYNKSSSNNIHDHPNDILDQMLQHYDASSVHNLTRRDVRQLRDEIKTFMLAGHETSAAMMTWCLYELMIEQEQHKQKQGEEAQDNYHEPTKTISQQLIQEADSVFYKTRDWKLASIDDLPDREQLARLVLSEASLREALRKYSVVPIIPRLITQDVQIGTIFLPKNTSVMINISAIHLDPDIWPDPMKFDPNRFVPIDNENEKDDGNNNRQNANDTTTDELSSVSTKKTMNARGKPIQPFTFLAFIAGPRNCLGQYLALLESKMVISLLLQRYELTLVPPPTMTSNGRSSSSSPFSTVSEMDPQNWDRWDPRHRFMVPVIPKQEIMVYVTRR